MENGKIAATGTHEALLKKSELYRSMWIAHLGARDEIQAEKREEVGA